MLSIFNKSKYLLITSKPMIYNITKKKLLTSKLELNRNNITSYSLFHTIKDYAKQKTTPIKLNMLLEHASNTRNNHQMIIRTQFLYKELPIRLAQRIMELNELPYNLLKLGSMNNVYNLYIDSFEKLISSTYPSKILQAENYSKLLQTMIDNHVNINNNIANALLYFNKSNTIDEITENNINTILEKFYTSRLSIRFLVQQHIELTYNNDIFIGIINTKTNPYNIINNCIANIEQISSIVYGRIPLIEFDENCDTDIEMIYIDSHIRYMVIEILKNAVRATMENTTDPQPIKILLKQTPDDIIIKISDNSGGFNRKLLKHIFNFTYTTAKINDYINVNNRDIIIAGYGHGLGLSRIYARYFGGDIVIIPLDGIGTDVYIYINRLGNSPENICDFRC